MFLKHLADTLRPAKAAFLDRIIIERGEILKQTSCESILFFMMPNLSWGGHLNQNLLFLAGPDLDKAVLETVHHPKNGDVFALPPCGTPYRQIYMAVLGHWDGGNGFEERDLMNCYRRAIELAQAQGIRSIAIPALGRDKRDFPHVRFARLALRSIVETLDGRMDKVVVYCVDHTMFTTYQTQHAKLGGKL